MALGDTEQFSLRWNNFHSNLSSGFQSLLAEEDLVDVTLAAGGGVLQAHKIILSICSPYFKQLFKINPCKHPIVILKDVQHKDLVDILQFMYQGEVNVRQEDLGTFLKTAELLQIKGLTGQDSPGEASNEPETPVPNSSVERTVPRNRQIRRRIEKPLPSGLPRLEKQPSSRAQSPLPPFKRMRTDTPSSRSPVILSDDTSGVECIDLKSPKVEPVDYESAAEPPTPLEGDKKESPADETMTGESSSHSRHDSMQGAASESDITQDALPLGVLQHSILCPDTKPVAQSPSVSGASSEMNTSQDGESGSAHFVWSRKGKVHLVYDGFRYYIQRVTGMKKCWRCIENRTIGCRAWLYTEGNQILHYPEKHNHGRNQRC